MENMQLGPKGGASGNASGASSGYNSPAASTPSAEEQIPVIDANEDMNFGDEEGDSGVNVKDIPF